LFARLCKRAVGHEPFAVAHPDAGRCCHRVERGGRQILPSCMEFVRELRGFHVTLLPFGGTHGLRCQVNQQHVLHMFASIVYLHQ
jgi:hypothetical protein